MHLISQGQIHQAKGTTYHMLYGGAVPEDDARLKVRIFCNQAKCHSQETNGRYAIQSPIKKNGNMDTTMVTSICVHSYNRTPLVRTDQQQHDPQRTSSLLCIHAHQPELVPYPVNEAVQVQVPMATEQQQGGYEKRSTPVSLYQIHVSSNEYMPRMPV